MNDNNGYAQTKKVHDLLLENLKKEEARLEMLIQYERDVALQIEDATRVILGVKRCIATLKSGIPSSVGNAAKEDREEAKYNENINKESLDSHDGGYAPYYFINAGYDDHSSSHSDSSSSDSGGGDGGGGGD